MVLGSTVANRSMPTRVANSNYAAELSSGHPTNLSSNTASGAPTPGEWTICGGSAGISSVPGGARATVRENRFMSRTLPVSVSIPGSHGVAKKCVYSFVSVGSPAELGSSVLSVSFHSVRSVPIGIGVPGVNVVVLGPPAAVGASMVSLSRSPVTVALCSLPGAAGTS